MFSLKIRYTLYGMILTTSLITLVAQATTTDGVFGEYFRRMVGTCNLSNAEVLTGFDSNPSVAIFGTKACTTLTSLLDTIGIKVIGGNVGIGTVAAPTARLQVVGMVKSSPTTIADSSDTLTTRSYVDAGLVDMCTKIGGIWDYITNKCDTIYWQIGSYGPCSESCGPGTQDAPYVCKDNFGTILTESSCDGKIKPPNASRDCTEKACVGSYCSAPYPTCASYGCTLIKNPTGLNQPWKKGSLSCGFSCDGGFSGPTCSTPPLSYSWQIGSYGPCSESCGLGVEFAPYVCKDNMGIIVDDSFCASAGAKPEAAGQACNKGGCPGAYCSAIAPTCASNGGCTLGQAPTTPNQSYVKNSISCGYTCVPNYSGTNCETYTALSCSSIPPSCSPTGCKLNEGSPSSASQAWIKDASSCGYICKPNYSGTNCETYTAPVAMCDYMGVNENRFTVQSSIPEGASSINATYDNSPFSYIGPSYDPIYGGNTVIFDKTGYNSITGYYLYNNAVLNSPLGHTNGWWGGPITYGNCHY